MAVLMEEEEEELPMYGIILQVRCWWWLVVVAVQEITKMLRMVKQTIAQLQPLRHLPVILQTHVALMVPAEVYIAVEGQVPLPMMVQLVAEPDGEKMALMWLLGVLITPVEVFTLTLHLFVRMAGKIMIIIPVTAVLAAVAAVDIIPAAAAAVTMAAAAVKDIPMCREEQAAAADPFLTILLHQPPVLVIQGPMVLSLYHGQDPELRQLLRHLQMYLVMEVLMEQQP